jgi:hypothetical protein
VEKLGLQQTKAGGLFCLIKILFLRIFMNMNKIVKMLVFALCVQSQLVCMEVLTKTSHENNNAKKESLDKLFGVLTDPLCKKTIQLFLKKNLIFFDGMAGNNQCHLNALSVVKLTRDENFVKSLSRFDLSKKDEDLSKQLLALDNDTFESLQFLMCNLLVGLTFSTNDAQKINNIEVLLKVKLSNKLKTRLRNPKSVKAFINFFILNKFGFSEEMSKSFPQDQNGLITIPKFIGISNFISEVADRNIWSILVCKTISKDGFFLHAWAIPPMHTCFVPFQDAIKDGDIKENDAVVVIEGFNVPDGSMSVEDVMQNTCPWNLFHGVLSETKNHECIICKNKKCELLAFPVFGCDFIALTPRDLHFACAAAFMAQDKLQSKWIKEMLIQMPDFFNCLIFAQKNDLQQNNPRTFFIQHMFPASVNQVLDFLKSGKRFIDTPSELILKKEGVL